MISIKYRVLSIKGTGYRVQGLVNLIVKPHLPPNQSGQVVIVLLLIMLVSLAIGLSILQRSINDVASSTQSEQSTRAFSAAEAGIETALAQLLSSGNSSISLPTVALTNDSSAEVTAQRLPKANSALVYPPLGKDTVAQFWLSDPASPDPNNMTASYTTRTIDLYFGNPGTTGPEIPALEVNTITQDAGGNFIANRAYYDPRSQRRDGSDGIANGFAPLPSGSDCSGNNTIADSGTFPTPVSFLCRARITLPPTPAKLIMMRVRILYSTTPQNIAVSPVSGSLPLQASAALSTGRSGLSQRTLNVFRVDKAPLPFLDYVIFSVPEIRK